MADMTPTLKSITVGTLAFFGAFHIIDTLIDRATSYECGGVVVTVQPNDSVWSIASRHCEGHTGFATDAIVERYGSVIHPGQTITLP